MCRQNVEFPGEIEDPGPEKDLPDSRAPGFRP